MHIKSQDLVNSHNFSGTLNHNQYCKKPAKPYRIGVSTVDPGTIRLDGAANDPIGGFHLDPHKRALGRWQFVRGHMELRHGEQTCAETLHQVLGTIVDSVEVQ